LALCTFAFVEKLAVILVLSCSRKLHSPTNLGSVSSWLCLRMSPTKE